MTSVSGPSGHSGQSNNSSATSSREKEEEYEYRLRQIRGLAALCQRAVRDLSALVGVEITAGQKAVLAVFRELPARPTLPPQPPRFFPPRWPPAPSARAPPRHGSRRAPFACGAGGGGGANR